MNTDTPTTVASEEKSRRLTNVWLFISLSCPFFLLPLTTNDALARLFTDCLFTLIIFLSILGQTRLHRSVKLSYAIIGLLAVISTWIPVEIKLFTALHGMLFVGFFAFSVYLFCHRLFSDDLIDVDTLLGAACTYILLGVLFACIYQLVYLFDPDAFLIESGDPFIPLLYFSFVTLTTLGYGDVLPLTETARLISVYEAIIGQIFGTVVVALLVGNYVAMRNSNVFDA